MESVDLQAIFLHIKVSMRILYEFVEKTIFGIKKRQSTFIIHLRSQRSNKIL